MFKWLEELNNIRLNYRERTREVETCASCEILKQQNSILNDKVDQLINRLLESTKPVESSGPPSVEIKHPLERKTLPWNARRQLLEREDRDRAKKLKVNQESTSSTSVAELEKELDIVEDERSESNAV